VSEDLLLEQLGEAFDPPAFLPTEPSLTELAALERAVRRHHAPAPAPRRAWHRSSRRAAGLVVALVFAGAGTAAAATGSVPLPRPVRALAHDLGLPVESPEVHAVHDAVDDLHHAQANGDQKAVIDSAVALRRALDELGPREAHGLQSAARADLAAADQAPDGSFGPSPAVTTAPPTTGPPVTDTVPPDPPATDVVAPDPPVTDTVPPDPAPEPTPQPPA
jgi:hypothetical protein